MTKNEIKKMVNTCNNYYSCALCPYNPEDISRFIGDRWKGGCPDYDRKLVYAMGKGYGNVSEYKTERKMLRSQIKVLKQRLNDKYIEIDNLNRDYRNAFERLKSQQREIDAVKADNEELTKVVSSKVYDLIGNAKEIADAREVWEKQAKIDVLNKLKERACGLAAIETYHICNLIDELLKEYEECR